MLRSDELVLEAAQADGRAGELVDVARRLLVEADAVATLLDRARWSIAPEVWLGPAAERAKAESDVHAFALRSSSDELRDVAAEVLRQVQQLRDEASSTRAAADAAREAERQEEQAAANP